MRQKIFFMELWKKIGLKINKVTIFNDFQKKMKENENKKKLK